MLVISWMMPAIAASLERRRRAKAAVPAGWSWDSSQKAQPATLYERPAAGTSEMAPSLFEKPANSSLAGGAGYLGSLPVRSGVMQPMIADVGNVIKPN